MKKKKPTKKKPVKKKIVKQEKKVEPKALPVAQPTKFILRIAQCGTDTFSGMYKKVEHDNPILLGLAGVNIMADGFSPKEAHPFFKYLLACSILKGLDFDRDKFFSDVDNIADRIKSLSLKEVKGGTENGRLKKHNKGD